MGLFGRIRAAFALGDITDPLGRSLVVEQFRILRKQVPVLYAVLLVDSISVALVLPVAVSGRPEHPVKERAEKCRAEPRKATTFR